MKNKKYLILSTILLILIIYVLFSKFTARLPSGRTIQYCDNSSGDITNHGCKDDKRVATIRENFHPKFYQPKFLYFIGTDMQTSEKAIFSTISKINESLNGAVVRIASEGLD